MAFQRLREIRNQAAHVLSRCSAAFVHFRQIPEEALGAPLHDGEHDTVLRAEVVVHGAERDSGLLDDPGDGRGLEAVGGHHALCGVEDQFAWDFTPRRLGLTVCSVAAATLPRLAHRERLH